ncbi:MAG: NUDIX domain-containing protein [Chloroflexi bacterium]|nr:NUDIX domain-containing protein [Chloroflexota bacterium]
MLLVQRVNHPAQGLWTLPAGFVDSGEDPAKAAERECLEETGLVVHVTGLIDVVSGREHEHGADIVIAYRAELLGGELVPGDDAGAARFYPVTDLPPLAFKATRQILQAT